MEMRTVATGVERATASGPSSRAAFRARSTGGALATAALVGTLLLTACGGAGGDGDAGAEAAGEMQPADTAAAAMAGEQESAGLLDPNDASEEQLRAVEGLPDSVATALVEGRPFADVLALDQALAAHMDSASRQELYRRVWLPIDLNEASDEAILLIPGVGDRMLGEFKEYRPYRAMEEFRREIGKYVDEDEVARLEMYVTLGGGM